MGQDRSAWVLGRPAPPLRPFVDGYVGYRQVGLPSGLHRGLPSRHLTSPRPTGRRAPGDHAAYVVCDDPDALFERASAAGAEVVQGLKDQDHGSRGFTVRDLEGNLWSFGTYRSE